MSLEVGDSSPAIGPDGTIYIGSQDYKVYSVNPGTGQINPGWPFVTGYIVRSSPAIAADGTILIGSYDGKLYALNPDGTSVGAPWPFYTGDCNCDGSCNVSDAVYIINYVFVGGNEPCDTNGDGEPDC